MSTWDERRKRESDWLAGLQTGDDVMVCHSSIGGSRYEPATIERMTKTLFIVGHYRFNRDGTQQGSRRLHGGVSLVEPTTELLDEISQVIRRDKAMSAIHAAKLEYYNTLKEMPLDRLERIAEACKETNQ